MRVQSTESYGNHASVIIFDEMPFAVIQPVRNCHKALNNFLEETKSFHQYSGSYDRNIPRVTISEYNHIKHLIDDINKIHHNRVYFESKISNHLDSLLNVYY